MALPLNNSFEGQSAGTTMTTGVGGNTGGASGDYFTVSTGASATATFSGSGGSTPDDIAINDTMSGRVFIPGGTSVAAELSWLTAQVGSQVETWGRVYFRFSTLTNGQPCRVLRVFDTDNATTVGIVFIQNTTGQLRVSNGTPGSQTNGSLAYAVLVDTVYRLEWYAKAGIAGVAVMTANLYLGHATSVVETATRQTEAGGTNCGAIRFGINNVAWSAPFSLYVDSINANATGFPGPVSTGSSPHISALGAIGT